ncbi:DNA-binding protein [Streptomyces sp. NK15101]|uniref:DNA-binding protein n=1 Tax=Streptomyces sp. NK15101 TaxID=2873261 RepID=UPI001CEDBCFB|nr:DNA-binding protein [Streptomyces sp. NK15101]
MAEASDRPETDLPRGIGAPATHAPAAAGCTRLDGVPAAELAALGGVGPKALRVLSEAPAEQGSSPG